MFYIPVKNGYEFITDINEVIVLTAKGNYTIITLIGGSIIKSSYNIGKFKNKFLSKDFFEASKSVIINKKYIKSYCKSDNCIVLKNNLMIKICIKKTSVILDLLGATDIFEP